ncbi:MAG: hypothetical protein GX444_05705 [Myxococcales bacterium]|nr:hypothetical protein [Myxococcales bacterium]
MKLTNLGFALALLFVLVIPFAASAEEPILLPEQDSFHLDVRFLSLFNISAIGLSDVDEDTTDNEALVNFDSMTGGSTAGLKLGYLMNGHHDVGAHVMAINLMQTNAVQPKDDDADVRTSQNSIWRGRLAGYYNYNFRPSTFVMPYVGPVLGIDVETQSWTEQVGDEDKTTFTRTYVKPLLGAEGGVRIFPVKNVAFDFGLLVAGGPAVRVDKVNEDDLDRNPEKNNASGAGIDIGLNAGLSVFF